LPKKDSLAAESHKHHSPHTITIAIITVSSSRFRDRSIKDDSGEIALKLSKNAGHHATLEVVDDEKQMLRLHVLRSLFEGGADAVVTLGGTGLAPRDVTIEAIGPLLEKQLDGFSEIFRSESYKTIGSSAMMTRSLAGIIRDRPVFCLPGSPDAAATGMRLVLKEILHTVYIAKLKP
jgi:molybdopterin adenylyltransferase